MDTQTFALYFGNRGFFPAELIDGAREQMKKAVEKQGFHALMVNKDATRHGAVETVDEGVTYAEFLRLHQGRYDGVIVCLPNFGDENGAIAALRDCGVPILIQAYPDEIGKMDFAHRRDAYCGKFSIMDVFYQYNLPFTIFEPHAVHPDTEAFGSQLQRFAAVCRVVKRMKRLTVGAIGARTTAFKTVRFDELTLQKHEITTETFDLSELFLRVRDVEVDSLKFSQKWTRLKEYTNWTDVPEEKRVMLTKTSVAIDAMINEYKLDALALRCWDEMEKQLQISPCVLLSELNDRGISAACELDVCNAVAMEALSAASKQPATVLDWNNNYGDDDEKCILFHCGPVPQRLMREKGRVTEHKMFAKAYGQGCGWGCNEGRIAPSDMTFVSTKTQDGKLQFYVGEGCFTDDEIEEDFFGCAGVARIENLQNVLHVIGKNGYRHHVGVTFGHVAAAIEEAFSTYLDYDRTNVLQGQKL